MFTSLLKNASPICGLLIIVSTALTAPTLFDCCHSVVRTVHTRTVVLEPGKNQRAQSQDVLPWQDSNKLVDRLSCRTHAAMHCGRRHSPVASVSLPSKKPVPHHRWQNHTLRENSNCKEQLRYDRKTDYSVNCTNTFECTHFSMAWPLAGFVS